MLALTAALGGCGKKGAPLPPEPRGPRPAESVRVRQIGDEIVVWFEVPEVRGSRPGQVVTRAELVRVTYGPGFTPPPDPAAFRRRGVIAGALEDGSLPAPGGRAVLPDRDLDALDDRGRGSTLRYAVRMFDARGREAPLATASDLVPLEVVPPPERLTGEATGDGIRLTWAPPPVLPTPPPGESSGESSGTATPRGKEPANDKPSGNERPAEQAPIEEPPGSEPAEEELSSEVAAAQGAPSEEPQVEKPQGEEAQGQASPGAEPSNVKDEAEEVDEESEPGPPVTKYNVYRAGADEPMPEDPLNPLPVTATEYLDTDIEEGERYRYEVRVLLADRAPLRESASSAPLVLVAEDRIAPAAPKGLVAVQEGGAVRLFWTPNTERDVAGYRVYRRIDGGESLRVGPDPVEQPTWVDRDVGLGQGAEYRVTAVDRATPRNESEPSEPVELEIVAEPTAPGRDR